jgi:GPH family glycoside/pentoside/hexuronide:cation symporter
MNQFVALVNYIYIQGLHYNPSMVSIAKSIPMFAGMVTGPAIGHLCDNTRTRWGRRKPWMVFGLILTVVIGMFLWHVPESDQQWHWGMFFFIVVMFLLLGNIGGGAYGTAAGAMGFEMTTDYNERTQLFKWGVYVGAIAGFLSPWLMNMCLWFDHSPNANGTEGVIYVSAIMCVLILITGAAPILFCKENISEHMREKKVPFFSAVRMTLNNGPFWLLTVSNFIMYFAINITGLMFLYLLIYYVGKGDQKLGMNIRAVMYNTMTVAGLLGAGPIASLSAKIGKKAMLLLMLVMSAIGYASLYWTFTRASWAYVKVPLPHGWLDGGITFQWPCLISAMVIGAFTNLMPMIKASMLADICDYDELKFGHRREGFYSSVFGVCQTVAIAVAVALTGILLDASGFDSKLIQQSERTLNILLVAVVTSQPLGFLVAITSILFYPLTHKRMLEIRAQIDARKAAEHAAPPV